MYYAEKVINGILHCRYSPNEEWQEMSKEKLTEIIIRLKENGK
jgi:hypothetical protein